MWNIFFNKEDNYLINLQSVEKWKVEIFGLIQNEIKQYFAKKVVTYFDYSHMFQQKQTKEMHTHLFESLSQAEKEMQDIGGLFNTIEVYLVKEENGVGLISFGLEEKYFKSLEKFGFSLVKPNISITDFQLKKLKQMSWSSLVFDIELVNYALGWIEWAPSLEERAACQAVHLLMTSYCKSSSSLTMKEKINFEEKVDKHPKYNEIYEKVYRLMPKIENQLEEEWKNTIETQKLDTNFGKIKKTKI